MKSRSEMTKEESVRYKQFLTCRRWLERREFDKAYLYAKERGFAFKEVYDSIYRGYVPKPPRNWVPPDQRLTAPADPGPFVDTTAALATIDAASDVEPAAPTAESALTMPEPERTPAPATEQEHKASKVAQMLHAKQEIDCPATEIKVQNITVSGDITSATTMVNGWPVETEAVIFNTCRNKKLLVIQLIDGRFAAIYRDGRRNWRIGQTIDVKLEEAQADPVYSWAGEQT